MAQLWDPEIDFGIADARRLIEAQFPEFAGAVLEPFGKGWDNRLLLMDGAWIVRFPVRHIAAPLIGHELAALPYLAPRLPLPIPAPELLGEPDGEYPFRWMGYRRLGGEVLCRIDGEPATPAMAGQLGRFLAALHGTDPGVLGLPGDVHNKADLPARFQQLQERIEIVSYLPSIRAGLADDVLESARELSDTPPWPGGPRIVHGDLYGYHVLSDGADVTGVIDWGDVHLGDPALDLSIAYGWFDGDARAALFDAYGDIDPDTHRRARFRALYYGPVLVLYGRDIGDQAVEDTGWRALNLAME